MKLRLSKEQQQKYKEKQIYFKNGIFSKSDSKELMNYYLYEIANGEESADGDLTRIVYRLFQVRDQIHEVVSDNEFMIRLCESFMIAHPESADFVTSLMQSKGIRSYETPFDQIRLGDYSSVASYVKAYAKGLKESERMGEKNYIKHSFYALEEVCYQLEEAFRDYKGYLREANDRLYGVFGFRELMAAGKEEKTFLNPIELKPLGSRMINQIKISDRVMLAKERGIKNKEQWVRKEWSLYDCTGDFLFLIYLYTESIMREALMAPKRKRSIEKYEKKSYLRGKPEKRILSLFKKYITNPRFESGIKKGVEVYLSAHPDLLPKKETKLPKKAVKAPHKEKAPDLREQMRQLDAGSKTDYSGVDRKKLKAVKKDAGELIDLLHVEEIDYKKEDDLSFLFEDQMDGDLYSINQCEEAREDLSDELLKEEENCVEESHALFTKLEEAYINLLLSGREDKISDLVKENKTTERLLVKAINEKFLEEYDDILIENTGREFTIIEDYLDELSTILEENDGNQ